jgi:hypothetical protein
MSDITTDEARKLMNKSALSFFDETIEMINILIYIYIF